MTLHDCVERLLCLLALTYKWHVLVSILQECPSKRHGYCTWSVVTLGLRAGAVLITMPKGCWL